MQQEEKTPELRPGTSERALEPRPRRVPAELLRALRPREKLLAHGPARLSHGELVGLVLDGGGRGERARRAAERLLRRHGLGGLAGLPPEAWRGQPGLGRAAAARLSAVFEIGRRAYGRAAAAERPRLSRPRQAFLQVRHLRRARKEHLVGLYLDSQNGLLHRETISIGSLNTTRTHPREILYPAIVHLALGFILAHNHPSGCLEPSPEDVEFTRAVQHAGCLMGIELYDHLIVGRDGYTSLRERGVL
jgi:DNA repair protein RadC